MSTETRSIEISETLANYAVGSMQKGTRKVAEFLAPTVKVPASIGTYKKWDEKSRFYIPDTLLARGGDATEIFTDATDQEYDCLPHGLDMIVDKVMGTDVPALVQDASDLIADIYGLAQLYETLKLAKGSVGAGTDVEYADNSDPVALFDAEVENVLLAGKCEGAALLFGANAWTRFKSHPAVRERGLPLRYDLNPTLFTADADYMGCFASYDTKPEGIEPVLNFVLGDEVLIFGRNPVPNRRDPSFMKTLRFDGLIDKLRVVATKDGRRLQVLIDWSSEIKVTNASAVKRINYRAGS